MQPVQDTLDESRIDRYKLVAHILAHEIGHVLERLDHHSDTGVMKSIWTGPDFQAMARAPLPFAEEDLEWIHEALKDLRTHRAEALTENICSISRKSEPPLDHFGRFERFAGKEGR